MTPLYLRVLNGFIFMTKMVIMSRASVSELKARLSHYLREVRRGGEVDVFDRGVPVARLQGIGASAEISSDERRVRLIHSGVLRQRSAAVSEVLEDSPLTVSTSVLEALEEERADRL